MNTDRGPIFIGGLDRSGKTLLRLALSSHPNIAMTRRTYMWRHYFNRFGDLSKTASFERCMNVIMKDQYILALNPDPDWLRSEFLNGERTIGRLFALLHEHFAKQNGKIRWGEQEGLVERLAERIFQVYPSAKIIQMIRDPRARFGDEVLSSRVRFRFGKAGSMIAMWLRSVRFGMQAEKRYPDSYRLVRYEDLLTHPEESLKEVCVFLGEEYDSAMRTLDGAIRFGREKRGDVASAWDAERVQYSLTAAQALSEREIQFMQSFAERELIEYGYPIVEKRFSLMDRLFYLFEWPVSLARMKALPDFDIN